MANVSTSSDSVMHTDSTEWEVVTAGEYITAGQVVFRDDTDAGTYKLAGADVLGNSTALGISLCVSSDGQPLVIATGGEVNIGGTVAVGNAYFLSGTSGAIAPEADILQTYVMTRVGIATSTTNIKIDIDPSETQLP